VLADITNVALLATAMLIQAVPLWEEERNQPVLYTNPDLLLNIRSEGIKL